MIPFARHLAVVLLLTSTGIDPARPQMLNHGAEPVPARGIAGSAVTAWSIAADRLGRGAINWRTTAVVNIAIHDALNAVTPRYERWMPRQPDEPSPAGASPMVAMAAAAYQVLLARHPETAASEADAPFRAALAAEPDSAAADSGIRLGAAIGLAAALRYQAPPSLPQPFPESPEPGHWRPTPPFLQNGLVGSAGPFLFDSAAELRGPPPPPLGAARYLAEAEEVRRLGGEGSTERTPDQRSAAQFWAYQSSLRNFVYLAAALLDEHPRPHGAWDEARSMAQLATALADSFIVSWDEKRYWHWWRPITALNLGSAGVPADPDWQPAFGTPPHPDYPSGHATDCATGAGVLEGTFGPEPLPVGYVAYDLSPPDIRRFTTFAALAAECAESRIWAGAHFRAANEEGQRLGALIARRALASVPPVQHDRPGLRDGLPEPKR